MNEELNLLDELVLLCLLGSKAPGATPPELARTLKPLVGRVPEIASALSRLARWALVAETPRKKGGRSSRWRLQSVGRDLLLRRLGGEPLKGRNWKEKTARVLAAGRVLNVETRIATALVKEDSLPDYFLAQKLGLEFHASTTAKGLARMVAGAALETVNGESDTLWRGIFRRGLEPQKATVPEAPISKPERVASDGDAFIEQVKGAARRAREGWLGPQKLLIHRAWEAWQSETGNALELAAFKRRLLAALRAGEIGLRRADFTETLNPADIEQAEIRDGNETFHFVSSEREEN